MNVAHGYSSPGVHLNGFPFRQTDQPAPSSRSSNRMPAAVKDAIRFAVEKYGGHKPDAAIEFVNAMERDGRLIEECWS